MTVSPELVSSVTKSLDNKSKVESDNKTPSTETLQREELRHRVGCCANVAAPVSGLVDDFI